MWGCWVLVQGLSTGNVGVVSLIDSWLGVAGNMVVFEALSWLIVLRQGKRVFIPWFKSSGPIST